MVARVISVLPEKVEAHLAQVIEEKRHGAFTLFMGENGITSWEFIDKRRV